LRQFTKPCGKWWDVDPELAHVLEGLDADLQKALSSDSKLAKAMDQPIVGADRDRDAK
jgi:hypothetical protein